MKTRLLHRRRPRWVSTAIVALSACLVAVGCGQSSQDSETDSTTVKLGISGQSLLAYLPVTLAQQLGYYEEAGLNVELIDMQSGSQAITGLLAGDVDVVSGYFDHTIQVQAKGKPAQAFTAMLTVPSMVVAVAPGSAGTVSSLSDLVGQPVGVTSPGSGTDYFLKFLLEKNGIDPQSVPVVGIGAGSTAVAAMQQGQVKAAVMLDPAVEQLEAAVGQPLTALADTRTTEGVRDAYGVDTYPASVLYANVDWVAENKETAQKLAEVIAKTVTEIQAMSGADIASKMPPALAGGQDQAVYAKAIDTIKSGFSTTGYIDPAGVEAAYNVLKEFDPAVKNASNIDLQLTYTNEFASQQK